MSIVSMAKGFADKLSSITSGKLSSSGKRSGSSFDSLVSMLRGSSSASGITVSESTSLNLSAVWNALTLISETMSTIPLQVFRKTADGRETYQNHPLYSVLHDKANRTESAQSFREVFSWNMEMRGIGLAEKVRDGFGQIRELWNINPEDLVEISIDQGQRLQFKFSSGSVYGQDRIFFCYGPGRNGLTPRGRLSVARESLGLTLAAQEYGSRFFGQGTHSGGFLTHDAPKPLSDLAYQRLKADLNAQYEGLDNAHKLILLEEGMKFTPAGMSNEDSQFLETRKFQISEIARFFNVKAHMLGDLDRATFSNIEHQGIEAVMYCWRPRAVRLQQAINDQLLSPIERADTYVEHNLDGLMQGDLKSQADVWHLLLQDGVINADEVRSKMNMNNQPDGQGKIYFMPMNMSDKAKVEEQPVDNQTNGRTSDHANDGDSEPASDKKERSLSTIEDYRSWAKILADEYESKYKISDRKAFDRSIAKLMSALEKRGLSESEPVRMRNAIRYEGMKAGGVRFVIWRSKPECEHCQHLNGNVVPIGEMFAEGIRHAPLKDGCMCDVEAVT